MSESLPDDNQMSSTVVVLLPLEDDELDSSSSHTVFCDEEEEEEIEEDADSHSPRPLFLPRRDDDSWMSASTGLRRSSLSSFLHREHFLRPEWSMAAALCSSQNRSSSSLLICVWCAFSSHPSRCDRCTL